MDIHNRRSTLEQLVHSLQVHIRIGANRPLLIDFLQRHFLISTLLYRLRISDVVVFLECFWTETPELCGGFPGGADGPGGTRPSGPPPSGMPPAGSGSQPPLSDSNGSGSASTTYQTVDEYIAHLNSATTWVEYDTRTKTAKVLDLAGFVKSQKTASKDVGAFDGIARNAGENTVHGLGTTPLHFAAPSRSVIKQNESRYAKYSDWKAEYGSASYTADFAKTDTAGKDVLYRANAYNPMYFLSPAYAGYQKSTVAPHWRIRTGIMQGDTASTTEVNLLLALQNYGVKDVDFATVWGKAHVEAERTGDATTNFIAWVQNVASS